MRGRRARRRGLQRQRRLLVLLYLLATALCPGVDGHRSHDVAATLPPAGPGSSSESMLQPSRLRRQTVTAARGMPCRTNQKLWTPRSPPAIRARSMSARCVTLPTRKRPQGAGSGSHACRPSGYAGPRPALAALLTTTPPKSGSWSFSWCRATCRPAGSGSSESGPGGAWLLLLAPRGRPAPRARAWVRRVGPWVRRRRRSTSATAARRSLARTAGRRDLRRCAGMCSKCSKAWRSRRAAAHSYSASDVLDSRNGTASENGSHSQPMSPPSSSSSSVTTIQSSPRSLQGACSSAVAGESARAFAFSSFRSSRGCASGSEAAAHWA